MLAYKLPVACKHAAEVLRPGPVDGAVDDHASDVASAQFLWLRWKAEEGVDLALREKLFWRGRLVRDPVDVLQGIKPDMSRHGSQEDVRRAAKPLHAHALAFEIRNAVNAFVSEQLKATWMHPRNDRNGFACVDRNHQRRRKVHAEVDLAARNRF